MLQVDRHYGPFDWRLPEAHAIYWAHLGLKQVRNQADLIPLRRVIWQCMQRSFQRGRLSEAGGRLSYGPNLEIIPKTYQAYEEMKRLEPDRAEYISRGQANFIKDAIYVLYTNHRLGDAAALFGILTSEFPEAVPEGQALDGFVVQHVTATAGAGNLNRIVALLEGTVGRHYLNLALGDEDQANGYALLVRRIWENYQARNADALEHLGLPSLEELQSRVLAQIRAGGHGFTPELRAALGMNTETHPPAATPSATDTAPPASP